MVVASRPGATSDGRRSHRPCLTRARELRPRRHDCRRSWTSTCLESRGQRRFSAEVARWLCISVAIQAPLPTCLRARADRTAHRTSSRTFSRARTSTTPDAHWPPFRRARTRETDGKYLPGGSAKLNRPCAAYRTATVLRDPSPFTRTADTSAAIRVHPPKFIAHALTFPYNCPPRSVALCVGSAFPHADPIKAKLTAVAARSNPREALWDPRFLILIVQLLLNRRDAFPLTYERVPTESE